MAYSFLEPIRVGKMVLKNRIIVPAMARYLCEDGFATEDYIRYYEAMAKGGVAMVTVGIMPIDLGWPSTMTSQPCLGDDKYIPQLQKAVTAMHAAGAKVSFQPWMPGRAPYTYADAVERAQDIAIVNKLTKDEILNIERKYVAACLRCAACGVDAIEWHNAHNYLGEQFFSPYFNHRTDEYGQQNVENSMRFARECISKARRALDEAGYPNIEIIAKLNGSDILPGGAGHIMDFPAELHRSVIRLDTVKEQRCHRGLAAARLPHDTLHLSFLQAEGHVIHRRDYVVFPQQALFGNKGLAQVLDL